MIIPLLFLAATFNPSLPPLPSFLPQQLTNLPDIPEARQGIAQPAIPQSACPHEDLLRLTQQQFDACEHEGRWKRVKADNGQVYLVDTHSIEGNGLVEQVLFYKMAGHNIDIRSESGFRFVCKDPPLTNGLQLEPAGTYVDMESGLSGYAPPNSVLGVIGQIACTRKH